MKTVLALFIALCAAVLIAAIQPTSNEKLSLKSGSKSHPDARTIVNINGSIFYMSSFSQTFTEAILNCNDFNMKLVSLQNEEKQQMFNDYLDGINYTSSFWTSGYRATGDYFVWGGTGQIFKYINWAFGEPNLASARDVCVIAGTSTHAWYDVDCNTTTTNFVICEEMSC